jgi:drug/metabolite transporter (DMT)-like permease
MGQSWRYGLAALLLLIAAPHLGSRLIRPTWPELARLTLLATIGMAGFNVLLIAAVEEAQPTLVSSVVGAAPLALAVIAPLQRGGLPRPALVAGAILVSLGVVTTHGGGTGSALGVSLSIAAMACEVGFTLLAAPLLPRLGPVLVSAYGCALAAPLLAISAAVQPGPDLVLPTPTQLLALLWLAVVMTAVAFVLWYAGVARLGTDRAGLFTGLIPAGALAAMLLLGGGVAVQTAIGVLLTGAGISVGMGLSGPGVMKPS